jgi:hypothetical protein
MSFISFIKHNKFLSFSVCSGLYGFSRSMNAEFDQSSNLLGDRIFNSLLNFCVYSAPIFGQFQIFRLLNRLDFKIKTINQEEQIINDNSSLIYSNPKLGIHKDDYKEIRGYNYNVFI